MQPTASHRKEMRTDPSMNQQGDVGSPHISRMEGDLSKIRPIPQCQSTAWSGQSATRENQNTSDSQFSQFANVQSEDGSHESIFQQRYDSGSGITHPISHSSSWSNVVSSSSPIKFTRSSDETVLTINSTANSPHPNTDNINHRSRSFDTEERSRDLSYLPQSIVGLGHPNSMTPSRPQNSWGVPLPHPSSSRDGNPHQFLPTINQGIQGPVTPLHSPMMYSTPHPNQCFSPLSLCDSTDQTTPLSSPSMSPHITPMQGHQEPPMWQLSQSPGNNVNVDSNGFPHSQATPPHFRTPEPVRNYPPVHKVYGHARVPQGYIQPRSYNSGPMSPPRLQHGSNVNPHQHHIGQSNRTSLSSSGAMNRSSVEVLKTLLRKKACLYEPETSSAVALVTWLIGRRLAMTHGFFSRQQLQIAVHSCVASKIDEGHVTRTKVNRCMQIILNSCFHYIIPRSDGSEESGDLFRQTFVQNAVDDEHLLQELPRPWDNLSIDGFNALEYNGDTVEASEDDVSQQSTRNHGKHSGGSTDSGKRSVLLCFNENIYSAADVFRCHNEFIRDVAHAANLNLSIDEWKMFYSGSKGYKKPGLVTEASAQYYLNFIGGTSSDGNDKMDQQGLAMFHTSWCAKRYEHDHSLCMFAHIEVNRGWLRRDPIMYKYKPVLCCHVTPLQAAGGCFINSCPQGVSCTYAHSREEIIYHPESYKKNPCSNSANTCQLKDICPNTHISKSHGHLDRGTQGQHRHGKRHHATSKKTGQTSHGQSTGFARCPDGSPMLYIDPAPISEYENSLILPGLKALFRDFSMSVFNSFHKDNHFEYGLFGYKSATPITCRHSSLAPIGKS